ncbi:MAG: HPP family protein [Asticcacaulis sp.]|nr:HPP family protein [Asticcacaulis sp.]
MNLDTYLHSFWPRPMAVNFQERLRSSLGAALGIAFTATLSLWIAGALHLSPWLVAPLGASAVLVYAVPSSPLAQPWSVVGGNTVSALVGIAACNLIPDPALAAGAAVGVAIGAMFALRCLHPPGGAMALLVVLTHTRAFEFALFPALTNSILLVAFGLAYNTVTRKAYPHALAAAPAPQSGLLRITQSDFAEALARHNEVLDIDIEDLNELVRTSELIAYKRMAGGLTCADIMTPKPLTAQFGTHLRDAWLILQQNDIKALPVVDRAGRVMGLLSEEDFRREAAVLEPEDPAKGLARLLEPTHTVHSDKPEHAGQIMSLVYAHVMANELVAEVMPRFSEGDHRHVLVLDDRKRLVGMISTSDMMRALFHKAA